jgi:hypothetical protein
MTRSARGLRETSLTSGHYSVILNIITKEWRNWERAAVFSCLNEVPSLSPDR